MSNPPFDISARQRGYIALLLWGVVTLFLLRRDLYGLDESAARALLLAWSIADQVASSVITFGVPDLRAVLYLPVGYLWTGNVFAAKVLSAALLAMAAWLLYGWRSRTSSPESALLATGLLIISPLALEQMDTLSPGIYLLATFALGGWLDTQYRAHPRAFNGWFFAQLAACAFSVSLHPAGLAYPLALLWSWRTVPTDQKHQRYFLAGIAFIVLFILLIRAGWNELAWFQNPIINLGSFFAGSTPDNEHSVTQWVAGSGILALAAGVVLLRYRELWSELTGRTLLVGLLLGAVAGDKAWGVIPLAIVLYFGLPMLLRVREDSSGGGFLKQRGWVLALVFICTTFFMLADRAYFEFGRNGTLSAQDQLIKTLAVTAENDRAARESDEGGKKHPRFIVASEWPGRTMLACRCDTLPLPPAARDPQTQFANLHSVTYLLLDPKQTANIELARNLSLLGGVIETVSLQPGGVLLHVKEEASAAPEGKKPL